MSKTLSNIEYYKSYYRDEIAKRAWSLYNDDLSFYRKKMELDKSALDSIKEPAKPIYISVQKSKGKDDSNIKGGDFPVLYPNPFKDEINVLFSMETKQNVTFLVYGMDGKLFDMQNLGVLDAGRHNCRIMLYLPKGEYLFVLKKGGTKISNIIIKK